MLSRSAARKVRGGRSRSCENSAPLADSDIVARDRYRLIRTGTVIKEIVRYLLQNGADQAQNAEKRWLSGSSEHGAPPAAGRVEAFGVSGEQLDRHMNEVLVQETDDDASLAGHRGMHGVSREKVAEQCIFAVRRTTANLVAWIEITNHNGDSFELEKGFDLVP